MDSLSDTIIGVRYLVYSVVGSILALKVTDTTIKNKLKRVKAQALKEGRQVKHIPIIVIRIHLPQVTRTGLMMMVKVGLERVRKASAGPIAKKH